MTEEEQRMPDDGNAGPAPDTAPISPGDGSTHTETSGDPPAPDPLATAQAEAEKWKDIAYRATAEVENYRKRVARERIELMASAQSGLLEDLLPIIDNFRMGLDAARTENEKSMVFIGMSMVQKQLEDFLSQNGVTSIQAENQLFDPKVHEAVGQEHKPGTPEGIVLRVVRSGYLFRDKLLRPPSVIVSGPAPGGKAEGGASPAGET
jgi:molecular chaperone GrpE